MSDPNEEFTTLLEQLGLEKVQANITTNVFVGGRKLLAQAWVDRETHRRADAFSLEQSHIARSAKNAAWIAAIAAIIAAIIAIFSAGIAYYSLKVGT